MVKIESLSKGQLAEEMQAAESLISRELADLPGAPYTVRISRPSEGSGGTYFAIQVDSGDFDSKRLGRQVPYLNDTVCYETVLMVKGALYDAPPPVQAIDLDTLNKEIGDLKAQRERLMAKLTEANRSTANWEFACKKAEAIIAGIRILTMAEFKGPAPEQD